MVVSLDRKIDEIKIYQTLQANVVAMRITDQSVPKYYQSASHEEPLDSQVNYYVEDGFVREKWKY